MLISFLLILQCCVTVINLLLFKYHGHILTRDLTIIKNNKFGKIICSYPKYCEHKNINFTEAGEKVFFFMLSINVHFPGVKQRVSLKNLSQNGSIWYKIK